MRVIVEKAKTGYTMVYNDVVSVKFAWSGRLLLWVASGVSYSVGVHGGDYVTIT